MKVKHEPTKKEDEQAITLVTLLEFQNYINVSVDSSIYKHAFFPVFLFYFGNSNKEDYSIR